LKWSWLSVILALATLTAHAEPRTPHHHRDFRHKPNYLNQNIQILIAQDLERILDDHPQDFAFVNEDDKVKLVTGLSAEFASSSEQTIQNHKKEWNNSIFSSSMSSKGQEKEALFQDMMDQGHAQLYQETARSMPQVIQNYFQKNVQIQNKSLTDLGSGTPRNLEKRFVENLGKIVLVSVRSLASVVMTLVLFVTSSIWFLLTGIWMMIVKAFAFVIPPDFGAKIGKWHLQKYVNRYKLAKPEKKAEMRESAETIFLTLSNMDRRMSKWYYHGFSELNDVDQGVGFELLSESKEFTELLGHRRKLVDVFDVDLKFLMTIKNSFERRIILQKWAMVLRDQKENEQQILIQDMSKALQKAGQGRPAQDPVVTIIVSEFEEALQNLDGGLLKRFQSQIDLLVFDQKVGEVASTIKDKPVKDVLAQLEVLFNIIRDRKSDVKYMEIFVRRVFLSLLTQPSQQHGEVIAMNFLTSIKNNPNTGLRNNFLFEFGHFMSNKHQGGSPLYEKLMKIVASSPNLERVPSLHTILESHPLR
jgi:hypothetical protein